MKFLFNRQKLHEISVHEIFVQQTKKKKKKRYKVFNSLSHELNAGALISSIIEF